MNPAARVRSASLWLLLILLAGCATRPAATTTDPLTAGALPVPFIAQQPGHCGPAALAMLARYHGRETSQEEIGAAIYLPEIRGTLTAELAAYGQRFGFWTRQYRGSETDLAAKLAAGQPLIVLGKRGRSFHYFVVLADGDPLVVHSGRRAQARLARTKFLEQWAAAGYWTLLVCPPQTAGWELSAAEHNDLGLFYEQQAGDPAHAETHYQQAADQEPGNAWYAFNLGNARLAQQRFDEAAAAYRRAIALDPRHADAHNNLAWTHHRQGAALEEAVVLAERAIALNPARRAHYLDTLGRLRRQQGDVVAARAALEQALAATTDRDKALRAAIREQLRSLP